MKKIRVLLADNHQILRDGLVALINREPDMRVVGEAGDGREALQKAHALKPDVTVMDLSMPELNGLEATKALKAERPDVKVVVLTKYEDESYLSQLYKAGANGYVVKRSAGEELIQAIRKVAAGGLHFDDTVLGKALAGPSPGTGAKGGARAGQLSEREREVLIELAWGYSNKEIAGKLGLSVKTVETYKVRIGEKSGFRSRTEMVQYALRQGWLSPWPPSLRPPG